MTKKQTITGGFISLLGSLPTQFALLLTFIGTVNLPRDEEGNTDPTAGPLYHCVWIMHLGSGLTVLLNQHFSSRLGVFKYTLNTCVVVFNVVVLICICMEFFAKEEEGEEGAPAKPKTEEPDEVATTV